MRSRIRLITLIVAALLATSAAATSGDGPARRQWAVVYLNEPTMIGATIVQGPVVFVHDDAKMMRGEPCTSVLLFEPGKGPIEEVAAFHCIPERRPVAHRFTLTTRPNVELGFGCLLIEYQFAGDTEGHGVPFTKNAH
jgi:hypothetical protein